MKQNEINVRCIIFRCAKKPEMYLYVPFAQDEQKLLGELPAGLLQLTGRLSRVMELELTPMRKLARAQAQEVISSLQNKGYYLQMPPNEILKSDNSMLLDESDSF